MWLSWLPVRRDRDHVPRAIVRGWEEETGPSSAAGTRATPRWAWAGAVSWGRGRAWVRVRVWRHRGTVPRWDDDPRRGWGRCEGADARATWREMGRPHERARTGRNGSVLGVACNAAALSPCETRAAPRRVVMPAQGCGNEVRRRGAERRRVPIGPRGTIAPETQLSAQVTDGSTATWAAAVEAAAAAHSPTTPWSYAETETGHDPRPRRVVSLSMRTDLPE
mmetsp:Transcript_3761/g.8145  ORF Transcript_3761/g.8145 Transcript_3761/m.8145 type:complete len:222 (-) Transcript_3761:293-958(-)